MSASPPVLTFSDKDRDDLHELFRIYDFAKVNKVDDVVATAASKGMTPKEYFDDLFKLYRIQRLPDREGVRVRLLEVVPQATAEDIESVMRRTEMSRFAEADAVRTLERQYKVQRRRPHPLTASRHTSTTHMTNRDNSPSTLLVSADAGYPGHGSSGSSGRQPTTPSLPPVATAAAGGSGVACARRGKMGDVPSSQDHSGRGSRSSGEDAVRTSGSGRSSADRDPVRRSGGGTKGSTTPPLPVATGAHQAAAEPVAGTTKSLQAHPPSPPRPGVKGRPNRAYSDGAATVESRPRGAQMSLSSFQQRGDGNVESVPAGSRPQSSHASTIQEAVHNLRKTSGLIGEDSTSSIGGRLGSFRQGDASAHYDHGSSTRHALESTYLGSEVPRTMSQLSVVYSRQAVDEVMAEEVRDWIAEVVGPKFNTEVISEPNVVDALRSGVVLQILLQKMQSPPVPDEKLKVPKRATGFWARDNVAAFLTEVRSRFQLMDAQMFNNSDLCDRKDDRQVVTCLMAIARIAYTRGWVATAPAIIMLEREVDNPANKLTAKDMDRIIAEAERREEASDADEDVESPTEAVPVTEEKAEGGMVEDDGDNAVGDAVKDGVDHSAHSSKGEDEPTASTTEQRPTHEEVAATAEREQEPGTSPVEDDLPFDPEEGADNATANDRAPITESDKPECGVGQLRSTEADTAPAAASRTDATERSALEEAAAEVADDDRNVQGSTIVEGDATPPMKCHPSITDGKDVDTCGLVAQRKCALEAKAAADELSGSPPPRREDLPKQKFARVVWKVPMKNPAKDAKAPYYRSRRWDGIDVAVGNTLNDMYASCPESPWRFHAVAANAGEYVIYNRDTARKRVVFVRFIQRKLFIRYSQGQHGPEWVLFTEAVRKLDVMFGS